MIAFLRPTNMQPLTGTCYRGGAPIIITEAPYMRWSKPRPRTDFSPSHGKGIPFFGTLISDWLSSSREQLLLYRLVLSLVVSVFPIIFFITHINVGRFARAHFFHVTSPTRVLLVRE